MSDSEPAPLHTTLAELNAIATIRGDAPGAAHFAEALALVASRGILADGDLEPLLQDPPADTSPDVLKQLRYMFETGGWVLLESALADLPADLRWLYESGAVTLRQLELLHRTLGVTSAADLGAEIRRGSLSRSADFGPAIETAVAAALRGLRGPIARIPLGQAMNIAEPFLARLRAAPAVDFAEPVGSLRRGQDTVGDIEIVASAEEPAGALESLLDLPEVTRTLHRGSRRLYLLTHRVQIGVRLSKPETAGGSLLHLTGSVPHVEKLRELAAARGWTLDPEGLDRGDGRGVLGTSEQEIYAALQLQWIPPEVRNGDGEIEAAQQGGLPTLVSRESIKGDLHMHTEFSDGRDSVAAMVKACAALGYEYIAITDHSPHSGASRNLTVESVTRQAEEIADLRERFKTMTILHGCEVDILADGRLDFTDRVLERFDIVLASLHERAGHAPDQLLKRYLSAMRHPLVTLLTHPTNRVLPHRPGYDLDYDRLFEAAVETRTALEIDGAPAHLDLDGALARKAVAAGATVAVNSDCHRADMLDRQMRLGILTARRGWVEPRHVLNAGPIADVRAFIAAKRAG